MLRRNPRKPELGNSGVRGCKYNICYSVVLHHTYRGERLYSVTCGKECNHITGRGVNEGNQVRIKAGLNNMEIRHRCCSSIFRPFLHKTKEYE